jgi:hypothetical protein
MLWALGPELGCKSVGVTDGAFQRLTAIDIGWDGDGLQAQLS